MVSRATSTIRAFALVLAAIVGCYALWLLTPELVRPQLPYFPASKQEGGTVVAGARGRAAFAARLGILRSDLWTDYAFTLAFDPTSGASAAINEPNNAARAAIERAIALGPHDARPWLLLAAIDARLDWLNRNLVGPLRMAYYTGPNDVSLMPMRLALATQSDAIDDPDLQLLAANDLRTIVLSRPDLRPAVAAAYANASPSGKHFIKETITKLNPAFGLKFRENIAD
jgi:hypothetical protein